MSTEKKIGITLGVLVFILCLVVCCWYVYILEYGPEKLTSTTVNAGILEKADGGTQYILTVDYKSNQNHNGLEMMDIKLSYFTDENLKHTYSQGIQYVANTPDDSIVWVDYENYSDYLGNTVREYIDSNGSLDLDEFVDFVTSNYKISTYTSKSTGWWIFGTEYKASYYNVFADATATSRYEYQALDNTQFTGSTNPIDDDSMFLLQVGEGENSEYVYMQFKGDNYVSKKDFNASEFAHDSRRIGYSGSTNYYYSYNVDYLAYQIYQQIQALPAGTEGTYIFEFADDMFDYYEVELDGSVGEEILAEDTTQVINRLKSYYTIYVTISADGAKNSNDSMFGILHGSPTYSLDGSSSSAGDYFQGRPIIDLDVYDFDLVLLTDDYYGLRLKQEFIDEYLPYADNIYLSVTIDVSILENAGYKYSGLIHDSGLSYFEVLEFSEINSNEEVA